MGKTRLAVTCAVRAAGEFPHGVYFVQLSMTQQEAELGRGTEEFLVGKLFDAIPEHRRSEWGLKRIEQDDESGNKKGSLPPLSTAINALKDRRILLVLDNLESLTRPVTHAFLQGLSQGLLHVLITTRRVPHIDGLGNTVLLENGMDEKSAYDLAVARIKQNNQTWTPTGEDKGSIQRIIRLTGFPRPILPETSGKKHGEPEYGAIPLALEIAVGNYSGLRSLKRIADALQNTPLGIMTAAGGQADSEIAHHRHDSITLTLDWSYGLLPKEEKRVFAASGLFAASFEPEALEMMANADVSLLMALTRNCLLRDAGGGRYTLHNLSRAYARVRLLGGTVTIGYNKKGHIKTKKRRARKDAPEICQRFVDWFSAFVQARRDKNSNLRMNTPEERAEWEAERENFVAASEILCETNILPPASANCLLGSFGSYLGRTGAWAEQEAWFRRFANFTETAEERDYIWATAELANVYDSQGRYTEAVAAFNNSIAASRRLGNQKDAAACLHGLANVYESLGRYNESIKAYEDSLEIKRRINDAQGEAASLHGLANVYNNLGRYDEAIKAYERSLFIERKIRDVQGEAASFHGLANVYNSLGRYDDAIKAYNDSLVIKRQINDVQGEAMTLGTLGVVFYHQGRTTESINLTRDAANILLSIGDLANAGLYLCNLAVIQTSTGHPAQAIAAAREAIAAYAKTQDENGMQKATQLLAALEGGAA